MANPASGSSRGSAVPVAVTPPPVIGKSAPGEGGESLADGIGPSVSGGSNTRLGQVVYEEGKKLTPAYMDPTYGSGKTPAK
jgi:hypothetical protein